MNQSGCHKELISLPSTQKNLKGKGEEMVCVDEDQNAGTQRLAEERKKTEEPEASSRGQKTDIGPPATQSRIGSFGDKHWSQGVFCADSSDCKPAYNAEQSRPGPDLPSSNYGDGIITRNAENHPNHVEGLAVPAYSPGALSKPPKGPYDASLDRIETLFNPLCLRDENYTMIEPWSIPQAHPQAQLRFSASVPVLDMPVISMNSDKDLEFGLISPDFPFLSLPSTSSSLRDHSYSPTSSYIGISDMMSPISPPPAPFPEQIMKQFAPQQQVAATNILGYQTCHPEAAIPAFFITAELAEVNDGRGWCLIANCGIERAKQRSNPHYDISKDTSRKRLDHLYDHIRDKHFNCRPFLCSMAPTCRQTFSREHDLKRHERTHTPVSLPCNLCDRRYTREDNLKRHIQLKHPGS